MNHIITILHITKKGPAYNESTLMIVCWESFVRKLLEVQGSGGGNFEPFVWG